MTSFGNVMTRSGSPICHVSLSSNFRVGGMSAGFPFTAPASTHFTIVAIFSSVKEMSFLKYCTPTFLVSLPLFLYRTFLLYANSFVTYCMFAEARAGRRCKKIRACMFRNIFGKPQHDECSDTNPRRRYLCLSMFAFQRTKPHKL